jgi:mevalonate kinase
MENFEVTVDHHLEVPIGAGFGTSGAAALSLALALNNIFGLGMSKAEAAQIAHVAEIKCKTVTSKFSISLKREISVDTTFLEISAEFEAEPLILTCRELFKAFLAFTTVVIPWLNETPAPLEPAYKASVD